MNKASSCMEDDFEAQGETDAQEPLYRIRYHVSVIHQRHCLRRCRQMLLALASSTAAFLLLIRLLRPTPGRLAILELLLILCFTAALVVWALSPDAIRTVHTDREGLMGMRIDARPDGKHIILHDHVFLAEDARIFERARLHALMTDPSWAARRTMPTS